MAEQTLEARNDPRRTALHGLAELLREQRFSVGVRGLHLTVRDGGRPVEIWMHHRPDDGNRLWFTWAGGAPITDATTPMNAVPAVRAALRRINTWPLDDSVPADL
ncbi:MAG TPA: hypothetical protein VHJ17_08370 [Thermomonospora sp.]|nr:hypothetical protein [Thermomonospora sp.]